MARTLDVLIVAATAVLSVRLLLSGLSRRYRAFFFYLIFAALRNGLLGILNPRGKAYYHFWVFSEPIEWLFLVLVVLEIYSLTLEDYQGLSTVGRWSLILAIGVALSASCLSLVLPSHYAQSRLMTYYYVADRAVYFSLTVFLLTILALLMQYPIVLSRNILVHSIVFSVYFLANTVIYSLLSLFGKGLVGRITLPMDAIIIAALGAWLAMLNPGGELRKRRLRPVWMPGREEELVSQLNNLNAALLRATRK